MDPEATLKIMLDRASTSAEVIDAAKALIGWVNRGGFGPRGWTRTETRRICNAAIGRVTKHYPVL